MRHCRSYNELIGSDNGLAPNRRQAIIWINVAKTVTVGLAYLQGLDLYNELSIVKLLYC